MSKKRLKKVHFTKKSKIHFMGIGGSGLSAVSVLAKSQGYEVSGCDLDLDSSYIDIVKKANISLFEGHSPKHLKDVDLLVISPAVSYQNKNHPEYKKAKKEGKLMVWQELLGRFILKGNKAIAVAGTHGKGTTTAILSLIFEKSGLEPSSLIGAKVKQWEANFRIGKSVIFILEADEFNDNFLYYNPKVILINNIEFDHPDFFKSEKHVLESFSKFVKKLKKSDVLVVNQDSEGINKLFASLGNFTDELNVYGYTFRKKPYLELKNSSKVKILKKSQKGTKFSIKSPKMSINDTFNLSLPGEYNVANSAGAIIIAKLFGIEDKVIKSGLSSFKGLGRRLDLIGDRRGIKVYDDYAHHPTAIKATLSALRQKHPKKRVWAVVEPHSFSRTKALLPEYKGIFKDADKVIIGPIFKARDKKTFGVEGEDIVRKSGHKDALYLNKVEKILDLIKNEAEKGDVLVIMGAGKSFTWSKAILKSLK